MNPQDENMQLPSVDPSADQTQAPAPVVDPLAGQPVPMQAGQGTSTSPTVAADIDLIEKEWVEKAKHIVDTTMGDPHAQSEKINKMKADYIKKRYNKNIRSEE